MPDCSVSYAMPREYRVASQKNEVELPPIFYEMRNGLYFAQAECALRTLQALFDGLRESGLYDRATIILHGDHGSQITRKFTLHRNAGSYSKEDYRAAYSTLFAVKYPGSKFFIDERVLPLAYLLEAFMAQVPAWSVAADSYPTFNPPGDADPEKVDPYVYFQGTYPLHRVDVNIFED
jgi:arylsulfatase A-like enzyme